MSASALVLDGHLASALAVVRDLRKRGIHVIVGAPRKTALALHSNAADKTFIYPDPKKNLLGYLQRVHEIAKIEAERTGSLVVPYFFSDDTFLPIARASEALRAAFAWRFSSAEVIEAVFDKAQTLAVAKQVSLPVPTELSLEQADITYPVIIKPRHSCVWPSHGEAVRATAKRARSKEEALAIVTQFTKEMGEAPLIQACIVGHEVGLFTVCAEGRAIDWFAHKRLLGIHPNGGASSIREALMPPPELVEQSTQLLSKLGWSGPAMVEWKYDESTNVYRLMEINGRWWGSLPLPLASGYPMAWWWYLVSTGQAVPTGDEKSLKRVRATHGLAVVKCFLTCLRLGRFAEAKRALSLCLPSKNYRLKDDVFSWSDPLPALWEVIDVVARG